MNPSPISSDEASRTPGANVEKIGGNADRFPLAVLLTLAALFGVGASRSMVTRLNWWRSGLEMLLVGSAAAAVAYGVGSFVEGITR